MKPASTIKATVAITCALAFASHAEATPAISGVQGDFAHGNQVTITGLGFGAKTPAAPYLWAPFEGSADPSALGLKTQWDHIGGLEFTASEGAGGTGGLKATDNSGSWAAMVKSSGFNWNDPGQKMYIFRKAKRNFDIWNNPPGINNGDVPEINYKMLRIWSEGHKWPNMYVAPSNGVITIESSPGLESGQSTWPFVHNRQASLGTPGQWHTIEILNRSNTNAIGRGDGFFRWTTDGVIFAEAPYESYDGTRHWKMWDNTNPPSMTMNFVVHEVKANATFPSDWRAWADDVYVDTTWARVMIGDAPTIEASRHREIQIPAAWSGSSITVTANLGTFPTGVTPYLFVIDADNNASPGFPLDGIYPLPPGNVKAD